MALTIYFKYLILMNVTFNFHFIHLRIYVLQMERKSILVKIELVPSTLNRWR